MLYLLKPRTSHSISILEYCNSHRSMPRKNPPKLVSFEQAMNDLEQILELLEKGELTLEESIEKFEHGVKLIKSCQTNLLQAEKKIRVVVEKNSISQLKDFCRDGSYGRRKLSRMNFSGIQEFLTTCSKITDSNLDSYYKISSAPPQLIEALRYTSLSDGKKIRPALIYAAAETYYLPDTMVHDIACATELIHTYSLIHDDLPAMDNDDFRRGKPSAHKKFNEAIAILAGDAMHAFAFEILAKSQTLDDKQKVQIIALLSYTAGTEGMCGGQMLDIQPNATKKLCSSEKTPSHENRFFDFRLYRNAAILYRYCPK